VSGETIATILSDPGEALHCHARGHTLTVLDCSAYVASGDCWQAFSCRSHQVALLPGITDCHACHGELLDNGKICSTCNNPLWKYEYLTIAD